MQDVEAGRFLHVILGLAGARISKPIRYFELKTDIFVLRRLLIGRCLIGSVCISIMRI